jgi:hypothetical protein
MTDRAEIERLLNKTGRTLEGLPEEYPNDKCRAVGRVHGLTPAVAGNSILHQSDVIELLVGALRDALDKPMQKPLTLEEATGSDWTVWIEIEGWEHSQACDVWISEKLDGYAKVALIGQSKRAHVALERYGKGWRCWASRPTDEEREAAAWES